MLAITGVVIDLQGGGAGGPAGGGGAGRSQPHTDGHSPSR